MIGVSVCTFNDSSPYTITAAKGNTPGRRSCLFISTTSTWCRLSLLSGVLRYLVDCKDRDNKLSFCIWQVVSSEHQQFVQLVRILTSFDTREYVGLINRDRVFNKVPLTKTWALDLCTPSWSLPQKRFFLGGAVHTPRNNCHADRSVCFYFFVVLHTWCIQRVFRISPIPTHPLGSKVEPGDVPTVNKLQQ